MLLFVSKLLPTLVYPMGLASLLILGAIFLRSRPRLQLILLISALVLLWVGGNRWVATSLARSLEWRYAAPEPIPQVEVVVVLGGGTNPAEAPRTMIEVNSAGDRLIHAYRLFREGKTSYILVSGGLLDWDHRSTTPADDMAELLIWLGVPQQAIWRQVDSANTYEDALFCARILKAKGINRIMLVTSAWHMPRALRLFEGQNLEVIPLPTDYNVTRKGWDQMHSGDPRRFLQDLFPSAGNMSLTTGMLKEYLGLWFYELRDWLG